jgi:hypothetical protein
MLLKACNRISKTSIDSAQGSQSTFNPYLQSNTEHLPKGDPIQKEAYEGFLSEPEPPSRPARVYGLKPLAFGATVALVTAIMMGAILGGALGGTLASCKKDQW